MSHEPTKEELFTVINLNFDASLTTKLTAANTIRDAKWQEQLDAQAKRIAELENEAFHLRSAHIAADADLGQMRSRAEAAEAKVARLREALEEIGQFGATDPWRLTVKAMKEIAWAALQDTQP